MAVLPKSITKVIAALQSLPGIGPKSAARLAFYLLRLPQERLTHFGAALEKIKKDTVFCSVCFNVCERDPCDICSDKKRDATILCVVEQAIDIVAIEAAGNFRGVYHVLGGILDPLNNVGPGEIRCFELFRRLLQGGIVELLIATNPSMEGEATALYIKNQLEKSSISEKGGKIPVITRLAHGLPMGADIEFSDSVTLSRAIEGRTKI